MVKFVVKHSGAEEKYDKYFKKNYIGFRTNNSSFFKNIIGFVSNITDQINIKLEDKGMSITTMDTSHIALINSVIPKTLFTTYNYKDSNTDEDEEDGSRITIWGVNLEFLLKILNQINGDDELVIYQSKNADSINISLINQRYNKFYSLKLMNIDNDELMIQDIPGTTVLRMESKYFNEIIKDCGEIGENLKIIIREDNGDNSDNSDNGDNEDDTENDNIVFECEGDMTSLYMVIHKDDIEYENLQDLTAEYSLSNIHTFSKGFNLNKNMTLEIGDSVPLKLSYKLLDDGFIDYYLAPKYNDDDD
jgi:proliferating cell nuclear antigen